MIVTDVERPQIGHRPKGVRFDNYRHGTHIPTGETALLMDGSDGKTYAQFDRRETGKAYGWWPTPKEEWKIK